MKTVNHTLLCFALACAALLTTVNASAGPVPVSYYSSLQGLSGKDLKDAIHALVTTDLHTLGYGSGNNKTWWGFYLTDRDIANNSVIDRYSYETFYFGDRGSSVKGMNIEHSFPKSWWGGTENDAYKDLFNLMPCESSINQSKSNYPMGIVKTVTTEKGDNGCTKVGYGSDGTTKYWEPADEWKGDFARGYMYMACAYQDLTWQGTQALQILTNATWRTFLSWAYTLYLDWAREDSVDELEATRVDNVQSLQGNRNPFVDYPNLMEYVWGDSTHLAFDPVTSIKWNFEQTEQGPVIDPEETTVYYSTFLGTDGGCTVNYTVNPGFDVWTNTENYGWKASAFRSNKARESDCELVTPEIDLSDFAYSKLSFEHAQKFAAVPSEAYSVNVRDEDGVDHPVEVEWPDGSSWSFIKSGNVDLSEYEGRKIRIVFHYTSTTSEAGTWEIKNMVVTGHKVMSALIQPVYDDAADYLQPVYYYDIRGVRVNPENYHGIAIRRQGSKAAKIIL